MYPFPMTMGLGAHQPFPMQASPQMMGLGQTPQQAAAAAQQAKKIDPVIEGVSGPMHIALGAAVGLAAGWFLFKK
jgi:hypothetical protein